MIRSVGGGWPRFFLAFWKFEDEVLRGQWLGNLFCTTEIGVFRERASCASFSLRLQSYASSSTSITLRNELRVACCKVFDYRSRKAWRSPLSESTCAFVGRRWKEIRVSVGLSDARISGGEDVEFRGLEELLAMTETRWKV